ncbi:small acid-soluble spore protein P [Paenibacillus sp. N1-5-1-14]|nr:small acid-soluble spore protein P [Paenibacillus radicibacter]MCR8645145.1 small acid-soluble spore protein P [Paenibacillus radicibacter]
MSKPKSVATGAPEGSQRNKERETSGPMEPLSGSHKVKNRNHTHHKNGEG